MEDPNPSGVAGSGTAVSIQGLPQGQRLLTQMSLKGLGRFMADR